MLLRCAYNKAGFAGLFFKERFGLYCSFVLRLERGLQFRATRGSLIKAILNGCKRCCNSVDRNSTSSCDSGRCLAYHSSEVIKLNTPKKANHYKQV